jgi:hypothetical protein
MRPFEEIAEAQGWSIETQLDVLRDYVSNQQSEDALSDYAETVAETENG